MNCELFVLARDFEAFKRGHEVAGYRGQAESTQKFIQLVGDIDEVIITDHADSQGFIVQRVLKK